MYTIQNIFDSNNYDFVIKFLKDNNIRISYNKWSNYYNALTLLKSNKQLVDNRDLLSKTKAELLTFLPQHVQNIYRNKSRVEIIFNILYPSLDNLPVEIIEEIVSNLTIDSVYNLAKTSKKYKLQLLGDEKNPTQRVKIQKSLMNKSGQKTPIEVLNWAIRNNDFGTFCYLIKKAGIDADDIRLNKNRALIGAAMYGNLNVIHYLVEKMGMNADDFRIDDNMVIKSAAYNGHLKIVRYLIEEVGLDKNDVRDNYNYAIRSAIGRGHIDVVRYLIGEVGLDINDVRDNDNIALQWASEKANIEMIRYLFEVVGLNADDIRDQDYLALELAEERRDGRILEYLRNQLD